MTKPIPETVTITETETMADCYVRTDIMMALEEFIKTEGTTFEHFLGFIQKQNNNKLK